MLQAFDSGKKQEMVGDSTIFSDPGRAQAAVASRLLPTSSPGHLK
jgi:hypothetical protein